MANISKVQATPVAIEDAISKSLQRYWRVKLNNGDTLYTYQGSTIGNIATVIPEVPGQPLVPTVLTNPGQQVIFDILQKGRFWHITACVLAGGQPSVAPAPVAQPTPPVPPQAAAPIVPGSPAMAPGGYPASLDNPASEAVMQDIATPLPASGTPITPAPIAIALPQIAPTPAAAWGGWQPKGSNVKKNSGFALSYAKDLVVAGKIGADQLYVVAEQMYQWLEARK